MTLITYRKGLLIRMIHISTVQCCLHKLNLNGKIISGGSSG